MVGSDRLVRSTGLRQQGSVPHTRDDSHWIIRTKVENLRPNQYLIEEVPEIHFVLRPFVIVAS